jgi:hypothetical protein
LDFFEGGVKGKVVTPFLGVSLISLKVVHRSGHRFTRFFVWTNRMK